MGYCIHFLIISGESAWLHLQYFVMATTLPNWRDLQFLTFHPQSIPLISSRQNIHCFSWVSPVSITLCKYLKESSLIVMQKDPSGITRGFSQVSSLEQYCPSFYTKAVAGNRSVGCSWAPSGHFFRAWCYYSGMDSFCYSYYQFF